MTNIHGFQVQSYGKQLTPGFKRGLRRLADRGFDDANCVVVKTVNGKRSGITHAGGRYVPPTHSYRSEVIRQMRELGMEPPPAPFIIAPGEYTLYHEWGHHVDRTWSGDDEDISFSFRWFSRFYKLCARPSRIGESLAEYDDEAWSIESDVHGSDAVLLWRHASSELFADLFEDWMRGDKKVGWDNCEPTSLRQAELENDPSVKIALLPKVQVEDVRAETYALFAPGIRAARDLPPVRPGLFGPDTNEVVGRLRDALARVRAERL